MTKNGNSDIAFIEALAELLNSKDLGEIEVLRQYGENDALEVRVSKTTQVVAAAPVMAAPVAAASAAVVATPATVAAPTPVASGQVDLSKAETSPMVGTVYLAGEPGAPKFIKVGDTVAVGQTLLIIEAMKTMNQIPASRAGVVKQILVEDATPVEYGDPLVIIE